MRSYLQPFADAANEAFNTQKKRDWLLKGFKQYALNQKMTKDMKESDSVDKLLRDRHQVAELWRDNLNKDAEQLRDETDKTSSELEAEALEEDDEELQDWVHEEVKQLRDETHKRVEHLKAEALKEDSDLVGHPPPVTCSKPKRQEPSSTKSLGPLLPLHDIGGMSLDSQCAVVLVIHDAIKDADPIFRDCEDFVVVMMYEILKDKVRDHLTNVAKGKEEESDTQLLDKMLNDVVAAIPLAKEGVGIDATGGEIENITPGPRVSGEIHENRALVTKRYNEFKREYKKHGYTRDTYLNAAKWMTDTFDDMAFLTKELSDPTDYEQIGSNIAAMVKAYKETPAPKTLL